MSIKTRIEDSHYMKALMRSAMQQQTIRGAFIETGFHLTSSPERIISMMNSQNVYLNTTRPIHVLGIEESVMEK